MVTETGDGRDNAYSQGVPRGTHRPIPVPIEEIHAANTITQEELAKQQASERHASKRAMLPRFRCLAEKYMGPLPPQVEEWLELTQETRPWLVVCEPDANAADAIAGRILLDRRLDCYREGALLQLAEFAERCNGGSMYGRDSIGNIIADEAGHQLLVIVGIGANNLPSSALLAYELSRLLERRLDRLLPTVLVELSPGRVWLDGLRNAGAPPSDVSRLKDIMIRGGMSL